MQLLCLGSGWPRPRPHRREHFLPQAQVGPSCIRAGLLMWARMAAGPGPGPPGPCVVSVCADCPPEGEPSCFQSAASLTAGAQRDAEEGEV